MSRLATLACCTMETLPVPAGTVKATLSPVVCASWSKTCAGSALSTTGRLQDAGPQAAEGTQTFPRLTQQEYPWRQVESAVHAAAQDDPLGKAVEGPLVQGGVSHEAVQKTFGDTVAAVV